MMTGLLRILPIALIALVIAAAGRPALAAEVTRVISPGGIEAWLVEEHAIPILSLKIAFRGGAGLDTAGREDSGASCGTHQRRCTLSHGGRSRSTLRPRTTQDSWKCGWTAESLAGSEY